MLILNLINHWEPRQPHSGHTRQSRGKGTHLYGLGPDDDVLQLRAELQVRSVHILAPNVRTLTLLQIRIDRFQLRNQRLALLVLVSFVSGLDILHECREEVRSPAIIASTLGVTP